ncbi:MAG: hypothetical protein J3Q66DRAFT_443414 [Benniella sp.]|nr:MAG: hypothetical protein J3Q66DRAFT_443414 [Benniella sp.]
MPRLKRLCIITQASSAVEIGQGAFQDCLVLEFLSLDGKVSCNNRTEGFMFRIPSLKCLSLGNGIARYFRLESIQHSPLLRKLTLTDNRRRPTRHVEVLNLAAWTWTMPQLSIIELYGRSALAFKFEWIRQCPSLKTLYVDVLKPAMLEPNMEDIAKGPCGERFRTCHLNFPKRKVNTKWLPKILETYCGHLYQLKLTRPSSLFASLDLGMALTATKALNSLEILTIYLGPEPHAPTLLKQHGLARGLYCDRTGKVTWFPYLKLKKLRIENSFDPRECYKQKL